jgi:hypothetical protein
MKRRALARQTLWSWNRRVALDKLQWGITTFQQENRKQLNTPFSYLMRKVAKVDPLEAAPRLRNRRQEPKK